MPKTVLVVDDELIITSSISMLIEIKLDIEVITFNDPVQAVEFTKSYTSDIDILISDFLMPSMNGTEFIRSVKEIHPETVCILLTGYADKNNAIECINTLGLYYYLEKPWDNDNLVKVVSNGLEKKKLTDELKQKVIDLEISNREIDNLYKLLELEYQKEILRNEVLEQLVAERTASIQNLLDNAGQGFLTFGRNLIIDKEYSSFCRILFGDVIYGSVITDILKLSSEEREMVETIFTKMLDFEDDLSVEAYHSLLPDEFQIKDKIIHAEFKLINDIQNKNAKKIMAIFTDITNNRMYEDQVHKELLKLEMAMKVLQNKRIFHTYIHDFKEFLSSLTNDFSGNIPLNKDFISVLLRNIHTFKGNFSLFNLTNITCFLHNIESILSKETEKTITSDYLKSLLNEQELFKVLMSDMEPLNEITGIDFDFSSEVISVSCEQISALEEELLKYTFPELRDLAFKKISRLKYIPLKNLLSLYPDFTLRLSERLEKPIFPFSIEGEEVYVNQEIYLNFTKSLVHVFRNCISHGIESAEDRAVTGKTDFGTVSCFIQTNFIQNTFSIIISDDGYGLNLENIKIKAVELGLISNEALAALSDNEVYGFIFSDGFSTSAIISDISGRGIGLSAVKNAVTELNGKIIVTTEPGMFTRLEFVFPLENAELR